MDQKYSHFSLGILVDSLLTVHYARRMVFKKSVPVESAGWTRVCSLWAPADDVAERNCQIKGAPILRPPFL